MTLQMTRRTFIKTAALGATALAGPGPAMPKLASSRAAASGRPHIVILQSDQHAPGVMSCAGHGVIQTPHMDALAATGVRFSRAVCPSPVCQASRTALITGYYPHQTGVDNNDACGGLDVRTQWTFPRALQQAGYHTALIGKAHFCHGMYADDLNPLLFDAGMRACGFDSIVSNHTRTGFPYRLYLEEKGLYTIFKQDRKLRLDSGADGYPPWYHEPSPLNAEDYLDAWLTRQAVQWIDEYDAPEPFLLWVNWTGPHPPWDAPEPFHSLYDPAEVDMPYPDPRTGYPEGRYSRESVDWSEDATRGVRSNYYGKINIVDDGIGRIVQALQAKGALENTLIIYCADHGELLGNHGLYYKGMMYQDAVGVPLIVSYPPAFDQNRVVSLPVNLIDLVPTILQTAEIEPETNIQGETLLPLLDGSAHSHKEAVFSQYDRDVMVMTDQYKYIWNPDWGSQALLFDYLADPREVDNLAGRPQGAHLEQRFNTMILDRGLRSVCTGNWHSPATWDQDRVPGETHDAYVGEGTTITVDADAHCRGLTVGYGATLILPPGVRLSAERFVMNLGALQQTQPVNDGDVAFLEIQNEAGTSTHFRGADVSSDDDLGEVTVSVQGLTASQHCVKPGEYAPPLVQRCYDITTAASGEALVRLWALTYELNGLAEEDLSIYQPGDLAAWTQLTASRAAGNDGGGYAFAEGQTGQFSVFLLSLRSSFTVVDSLHLPLVMSNRQEIAGLRDSLPPEVLLQGLWARSGRKAGFGLLLSPPLLLGLGALWAVRRRQNAARTPAAFAPSPRDRGGQAAAPEGEGEPRGRGRKGEAELAPGIEVDE
jgi:arylsulfatase A-like enzyme